MSLDSRFRFSLSPLFIFQSGKKFLFFSLSGKELLCQYQYEASQTPSDFICLSPRNPDAGLLVAFKDSVTKVTQEGKQTLFKFKTANSVWLDVLNESVFVYSISKEKGFFLVFFTIKPGPQGEFRDFPVSIFKTQEFEYPEKDLSHHKIWCCLSGNKIAIAQPDKTVIFKVNLEAKRLDEFYTVPGINTENNTLYLDSFKDLKDGTPSSSDFLYAGAFNSYLFVLDEKTNRYSAKEGYWEAGSEQSIVPVEPDVFYVYERDGDVSLLQFPEGKGNLVHSGSWTIPFETSMNVSTRVDDQRIMTAFRVEDWENAPPEYRSPLLVMIIDLSEEEFTVLTPNKTIEPSRFGGVDKLIMCGTFPAKEDYARVTSILLGLMPSPKEVVDIVSHFL